MNSCVCVCLWTITHRPGSSVHGILQARILEWIAISFSRGSSWGRDQTHISCIGKWILYHWATWEAQEVVLSTSKQFFVLVFWGCCNKIPQTGQLTQQNFIFSLFWMLEVQDHSVGRVGFSCGLSPWLADSRLPAVSILTWPLQRAHISGNSPFSYKDTSCLGLWLHPYDPYNPNYLCKGLISIHSHVVGYGFNIWTLRVHNSDHNTIIRHFPKTNENQKNLKYVSSVQWQIKIPVQANGSKKNN